MQINRKIGIKIGMLLNERVKVLRSFPNFVLKHPISALIEKKIKLGAYSSGLDVRPKVSILV